MQHFEANKKRLLTQQDWIGVKPSKPVSLQSLGYKQDGQIGRRRITSGKCSVAKRQYDHGKSSRRDPDRQDRTFAKPFQGHTKHEKPKDIRIRIGTDALTDAFTNFARIEGYAESEPCSEMMLFEDRKSVV